jgi:hypothetical protein
MRAITIERPDHVAVVDLPLADFERGVDNVEKVLILPQE